MRYTGPVINAGGTSGAAVAKAALSAHPTRSYLAYFNCSDTGQWISVNGVTAAANAAGCFYFSPLTGFNWEGFIPNGPVSIYCASDKTYTLDYSL